MTINTRALALSFVLALFSLLPISSHATVFFDDSFEGANPGASGWGYALSSCSGSPCPYLDVSTDVAHAGSKSLKKTYTESSNLINSTITVGLYRGFGTSATDVYKRYWYRTSGFTYGIVGTKHMYTEGQRPYFYSANLFGSREMTIVTQTVAECGYSTCNLYPNMASRPLADNVWYCIEEHTKLNTPGQANGVVELWVNGVQTIGYYNRTFLGPNVSNPNGNSSTHTLSGVKFYKEGGNGAIYYDQLAVGNTRID